MADPHIKSPMDWLDYVTVIAYRLGFSLAAPAILFLPWEGQSGVSAQQLTFLAAMLCASSLHFRLILQAATWGGLIFAVFGFPLIGLGGAFVTLGGLCFKEYFCFKVPGLRAQPLLLAALWFALVLGGTTIAQGLAFLSALLFLVTAIAKWRMPLHFDIGDKSKYEM